MDPFDWFCDKLAEFKNSLVEPMVYVTQLQTSWSEYGLSTSSKETATSREIKTSTKVSISYIELKTKL